MIWKTCLVELELWLILRINVRWLSSNRIKTDSLGQSKGFGYCEYRDRESVDHAVSMLNNKEFNGNNLIIAHANDIRVYIILYYYK